MSKLSNHKKSPSKKSHSCGVENIRNGLNSFKPPFLTSSKQSILAPRYIAVQRLDRPSQSEGTALPPCADRALKPIALNIVPQASTTSSSCSSTDSSSQSSFCRSNTYSPVFDWDQLPQRGSENIMRAQTPEAFSAAYHSLFPLAKKNTQTGPAYRKSAHAKQRPPLPHAQSSSRCSDWSICFPETQNLFK